MNVDHNIALLGLIGFLHEIRDVIKLGKHWKIFQVVFVADENLIDLI